VRSTYWGANVLAATPVMPVKISESTLPQCLHMGWQGTLKACHIFGSISGFWAVYAAWLLLTSHAIRNIQASHPYLHNYRRVLCSCKLERLCLSHPASWRQQLNIDWRSLVGLGLQLNCMYLHGGELSALRSHSKKTYSWSNVHCQDALLS